MIYQEDILPQRFYTPFITILVVAFIIFVLGVIITRWWAIKENWNDTFKPSIRLNSLWLIINLMVFILFIPIRYGLFIAAITSFLVNLLIGAFITSKFYEKNFKESLNFVFFIVIMLFIIWFILYLIIIVIFAIITLSLEIN